MGRKPKVVEKQKELAVSHLRVGDEFTIAHCSYRLLRLSNAAAYVQIIALNQPDWEPHCEALNNKVCISKDSVVECLLRKGE